MSQNLNKRCPCLVLLDKPTGVLHGITKCRNHVQMLLQEMRDEGQHYASLGATEHPEIYITEFEECFGKLPLGNGRALEIGAGTSPYVRMLQEAGYAYTAVEPSPFAADWLEQTHPSVKALRTGWEELPAEQLQPPYSLILAAHSIEHMRHGPDAIKKMASVLSPDGSLYIIVPNNEDLCNPDHWWFFTEDTLARSVHAAGLRVHTMTMRRRIAREQFIYCRAIKP